MTAVELISHATAADGVVVGIGWPDGAVGGTTAPIGWPGRMVSRETIAGSGDPSGEFAGSADDVSRETVAPGTEAGTADAERDVSRETAEPEAAHEESGPESPLAAQLADERRRRREITVTDVPAPSDTRVFTVANQKGGVGKTTTSVNLAAALAQAGMRVLVVDMDPQGNASTALGIEHHSGTPGTYDVLIDGASIADVVQESTSVPNLYGVPATIDLAGAEIELVPMVAREARLKKAIAAMLAGQTSEGADAERRWDYVFIDCPPSLGLLTINAFVGASEVLIPIQCEYYALEGLSQLLTNIEMIKEHLNPDLEVSTILLTMFDGRTRLSTQVADEVRAHFGDQVLRATIPRSVRISEAPSHGETIMTYDPSSTGALCYAEAAVELSAPRQGTSAAEQHAEEGSR